MRAYIEIRGKEYLLDSISWCEERLNHVCFTDESGKFQTVSTPKMGFIKKMKMSIQVICTWI